MIAHDAVEDGKSVELAALQPYVEHDQRGPASRERLKSGIRISSLARVEAFILQHAGNERADVRFVVDDENVVRHDQPLVQPPEAAAILGSLPACGFGSAAPGGATGWPVTANRSRIQAPRWPGRIADASLSSMPPP